MSGAADGVNVVEAEQIAVNRVNAETAARYAAQTIAERFVDDHTALRMLRVKIPQADPALYGMDGTSISNRYMGELGGAQEAWNTPLTDIAIRWPDGSLAYRLREQQRWEVWRTW